MNNWLDTIYSNGSKYFVSNPNPKKGETVQIKIRVIEDSPVEGVVIVYKRNGIQVFDEMELLETKNGFIYYAYSVQLFEKEISYHFMIATKDKIYHYNQLEATQYYPGEQYNFRILTNYEQPTWVRDAVFYQIFPERFCNGNEANDVQSGEYSFDGHPTIKMDWDAEPQDYEQSHCLDFFGGDLEGVMQKIPYFKKLGVTALYINPIFYAATVHKYDCLDYFMVDPHFGGDKALIALVEELHKNGMKIIIDVSINHTGTANKWFNKDGEFFDKSVGAFNNKDAKEREYYIFDENNKYHAWLNVETLPTLTYTSKALREKIYDSEDSLVKKWLKPPFNIDGWRFDVADTLARQDEVQLHHEVWPEIRKSIKEVNKEAYILGEDWTDCEEFLKGDEWDSSMNYFGCARPIREFIGEWDVYNKRTESLRKAELDITADIFANRVTRYLAKLPTVIQENQFNLLDSHDITRLHNSIELPFEKYRGAIALQYMLPGSPSIYYGDEVKIDGHNRNVEGCRYPMPWNESKHNMDYFNLYQTLSELKKSNEALSDGGFKVLYANEHIVSLVRFTEDKAVFNITSVEKEIKKIVIPVNVVGITEKSKLTEVFGKQANYNLNANGLEIEVPAEMTYVFEVQI
jgi:alpha-glucosidase